MCLRCGLVYESPRQTAAETRAYYEQHYQRQYAVGQLPPPPALDQGWKEKAKERLAVLQQVVPTLAGRRVLEIGSASGAFLVAARDAGGIVTGLEPAKAYARYCAETLGLDVASGMFEELDVEALPRYDVIAMFHVFEHLPDPCAALRRCWDLLSADGVLYLEVPTWRGPGRLRQPITRFLRPAHFFNFSTRSLERFLRKTGFKVIARDERVPTRLRWLARKTSPADPRVPYDNALFVAATFYCWTAATVMRGAAERLRRRPANT